MGKRKIVGLIMPTAAEEIPAEAPVMYPGVDFISRGINLRSLSTAGYDDAVPRIIPAASELADAGADAIMVIGTSLTFFCGAKFNTELIAKLRAATGLPASTMASAIVDGLHAVGARRLAVATAYTDEVNALLAAFLSEQAFDVLSLKTFGSARFVGEAARKGEQDIIDLSLSACAAAPGADALLIVCGGLRTLDVALPIEQRCGIPVISSMPAALWAGVRLVGESGRVGGCGRLLEQIETSLAGAQA
jgi:arylmalonate decarboxylase